MVAVPIVLELPVQGLNDLSWRLAADSVHARYAVHAKKQSWRMGAHPFTLLTAAIKVSQRHATAGQGCRCMSLLQALSQCWLPSSAPQSHLSFSTSWSVHATISFPSCLWGMPRSLQYVYSWDRPSLHS